MLITCFQLGPKNLKIKKNILIQIIKILNFNKVISFKKKIKN